MRSTTSCCVRCWRIRLPGRRCPSSRMRMRPSPTSKPPHCRDHRAESLRRNLAGSGKSHAFCRGPGRSAAVTPRRRSPAPLGQHVELTFKQNRQHGRHGWLRLTPAYSVRLVEQILADCGEHAEVVFDPFSGTGTTALCAAYRGKTGVATDINPFLIWLANAKARSYGAAAIASFQHAAQLAAVAAADDSSPMAERPALSNIERWWRPSALTFLLRLKAAVDAHEAGDATLLKI